MQVFNSWQDFPMDQWKWSHFHPAEMACKCHKHCHGLYHHDETFLDNLESLRAYVNRPLAGNSWTRCPLHNAAVGGAPLSQHKLGVAGDLNVAGWDDIARRTLLQGVMYIGFGGIGYARNFLHVDARPLKANGKPAEWDYVKGGMAKWKSLV